MATYFRHTGEMCQMEAPLTLTAMQIAVGGFIEFIELLSGDTLIVNAASELAPLNTKASLLIGRAVNGDVILCDPEEIA